MASDAFYADEPEITADSARQVTASQLYLCRAFAKAAGQSAKTSMFAAFFAERAEVLESLQPQISHLADVMPAREPNMRRFWQQSELTTAVARMEDHGVPIRLQPTQMVELAKATHEVTHNLGKALRRELLRGNTNLIDAHPRHADGPVRVGRRSRLETTLTDLVNIAGPRRAGRPVQQPSAARCPPTDAEPDPDLVDEDTDAVPRRPQRHLRRWGLLATSVPCWPRQRRSAVREGHHIPDLAACADGSRAHRDPQHRRPVRQPSGSFTPPAAGHSFRSATGTRPRSEEGPATSIGGTTRATEGHDPPP